MPERVRIARGDQELGTVDAADLQQAIDSGFRVVNDEEAKVIKDRRRIQSTESTLVGVGESLASGATFGLSRLAENALGVSSEEMLARQQQAGALGTAAEIGGGLIGGGGGTLAKGAGFFAKAGRAVPAGVVARQGARVETAVAQALGGGMAGKAAGYATRGIVEGGISGIGAGIDEAVLFDQELTPEALIGSGIAGAMLGGGVGVALPGIGAGLARGGKASAKQISRALERTIPNGSEAAKADTILGKALGWSTEAAGGDGMAGRRVGDVLSSDPKRLNAIINNRKALEAEATSILGPGLQRVRDAMSEARLSTEGAAAARSFRGKLPQGAREAAQLSKDATLADIKREVMGMTRQNTERAFTSFDQNVVDKFDNLMSRARVDADGADALDTFNAVKRLKKDVGELVKKTGGWRDAAFGQESKVTATNEWLRGVYGKLDGHLSDAGVYGDLAKRHADQNAAFKAFKDAESYFSGEAKGSGMAKLFSETGEVSEREAIKISRMYGKSNSGALVNRFDEALQGQLDYLKKVRDLNELDPASAKKIADAEKAVGEIRARLQKQGDDAALYDDWLSMRAAEGNNSVSIGAMSTLGPSVGGALGLSLGGPLGLAAGTIIGGLTRPATTSRTLAAMLTTADRFGVRLDGISKRLTQRARPKAAKVAGGRRGVAGPAVRGYRALTRDERKKKADAARESAIAYAQNPEALSGQMVDAFKDVMGDAPRTVEAAQAVAQRAAMFLATKRPPVLELPLSGQKPMVDPVSAAKWGRYVEAVSDPLSALERMDNGTLSPEHVEAIRSVYPGVYKRLQSQVADELAKAYEEGESVPLDVRQMVGLLFELPSTPGRTPDAIAAIQGAVSGAPQETDLQQGQAPQGNIRKADISDSTDQLMTSTQRVASGMARA